MRSHLEGMACFSQANSGVRIIMGETGCMHKADWTDANAFIDPIQYATNFYNTCNEFGIIPILWDDNGNFHIMNRNKDARSVNCNYPGYEPRTDDVQDGYHYCHQIFGAAVDDVPRRAPNCNADVNWGWANYKWSDLHSII